MKPTLLALAALGCAAAGAAAVWVYATRRGTQLRLERAKATGRTRS